MRTTSIAAGLVAVFGPAVATLAQCPIERLTPPEGPFGGGFGGEVVMNERHVLVADASAATLCPIVFDCATGAVYDFRLIDGQWERVQRLLPADVQQGDNFGASIHLNGDRLIVGSQNADLAGPDTGGAYIYDFDGEQWSETGRIPSPWPVTFAGFGRQVIINRDVALVNMPPLLYVFQEDGQGEWREVDRLEAPDAPTGGRAFGGNANALTEDWLFVGTPFDDSIAVNVGSVYVFRREGPTEFVFHQKIDAIHPEQGPRFGYSIASDNDQLFVGAINADREFEAQGVVYRFEYDGARWMPLQEITLDDAIRRDHFGWNLSLRDGVLLAQLAGSRTPSVLGAVLVFQRGPADDWTRRATLLPGGPSDSFGPAIATDGRRALVGAKLDDVGGAPLGAAHLFDLSCEICRPDLDADGLLTIFDFLTYLNLFQDGDAQADFDGDGALTIFDFLTFQTAFDAGCD
ncbi:MAG: GC-type dockerin domain-anchored protein [Phycisphaerales bacterium]